MAVAVLESGLKKWSTNPLLSGIRSAASLTIIPTDDVHFTLTGGTSFIHIESVGAGVGIQFNRPDTSDAGSMITWQTAGSQKWEAGPLGDGTDNWRLYNTVAGANAISVNQSTNVTSIASLTLGAALPVASGGTGQTSYTNGQLLIGNTTGNTLSKATLTGTANQVTVTNGGGSITLALPQSIDTGATVTFGALSLSTALPVSSGGTGQSSYTNGQLLIGNTTGNTLAKATLTGTANQVTVTNGAGSITLALPQSIDTGANVQFGVVSVGRSQSTYGIENYKSSSTAFINIETGNAGSNGSVRMANPSRAWVMGVRGDLSNDFAFADSTAGAIRFMLTGGAARVRFFQTSDDGVNAFQLTGGMAITGKMATYNSVATAGNGIPSIYGQGRFTAQTAAKSTVASYTVGASDASFVVYANVLVTASTTHSFTVTCAYTDEGNTARTITMSFSLVAGGAMTTTIANAAGAVPYHGIPLQIRCKASTTITIATTGTFTSVTYNVEGSIVQIS